MEFVKEIVGRVKWKKHYKHCLINTFVTVSDEALTLLALDNSECVWKAQALDNDITPSPKFTCNRAHRRAQDGWSYEGRKKFNEYFDLIIQNRTMKERQNFEHQFLSDASGNENTSMSSKNDNTSFDERIVISIRDELGNKCDSYSGLTSVPI